MRSISIHPKLRRVVLLVPIVATVVLCALSSANAATLSEHTGLSTFDAGGYYGLGFTVSGTGSFTDISLSLLTNPSLTDYAVGTGYLFSTPYAGTPSGLASSSYIGSAVASGGAYDFGSSLTLTSGDTYYFYEDTLVPFNSFGIDENVAGLYYFVNNSGTLYGGYSDTDDYIVSGTPSVTPAVPEPSNIALLGTGILGAAGILRRRYIDTRV